MIRLRVFREKFPEIPSVVVSGRQLVFIRLPIPFGVIRMMKFRDLPDDMMIRRITLDNEVLIEGITVAEFNEFQQLPILDWQSGGFNTYFEATFEINEPTKEFWFRIFSAQQQK